MKKTEFTDLSVFEKTFNGWTKHPLKDKPSKKKQRLAPLAFRVTNDSLCYEASGKKAKKKQKGGTMPLSLVWIVHTEAENSITLTGPDKVIGLAETTEVLSWVNTLRDHIRKLFNLSRGMCVMDHHSLLQLTWVP